MWVFEPRNPPLNTPMVSPRYFLVFLCRNDELNSQLKFKVERLGRAVGLPMTRADSESKDATIVERSQDLNSAEVYWTSAILFDDLHCWHFFTLDKDVVRLQV